MNFKGFFLSYRTAHHNTVLLKVAFKRKAQKTTHCRSCANYYNPFSRILQFLKVLTLETRNGSYKNEHHRNNSSVSNEKKRMI